MNKNDEIILVVERKKVYENEAIKWQGVTADKGIIEKVMQHLEDGTETCRRGNAEEDETKKQPIPYMVLKKDDEVFVYERLSGGGEARLHNKLSLGVGGHMNPIKGAEKFSELLTENTMRELEEEVEIKGYEVKTSDLKVVGLINDDEDAVGRVHLGLLGIIELPSNVQVDVKETDQLAGSWVKIQELKDNKQMFDRLENWSKIFVENV